MAYRWANEAAADADNLRRTLGRITALESEHATIMSQIAKLRGKVYALRPEPPFTPESQTTTFPSMVCENYAIAQSQGPQSKAAQCECDYCTRKRAERAQLRAAMLPRPQSAKRNGD